MKNYDAIKLENQLCFPLYACSKEVIRLYRKPLEKLNLTYTQYVVMMVLWEQGDITEGELGKIVHLDSGTLAPLLKRLEKQGLLTRSRLESNERKLLVTLTNAGEALKENAIAVPEEMQGCIPLSKAELKQLKLLLDSALLKMNGIEQEEEKCMM
ncbi:MarR family transcriptional regulator [Ruminococcus sp. M6(2020)]|uniref:HTH-type transcriptional regulator SarZ n=1 Tax=Ruminococcus difficilis TaxID=2763069 RepID=A0A934TZF2_9FIRM|nr:MarR family transcriptional regulator [Ruminococcus difficilis]